MARYMDSPFLPRASSISGCGNPSINNEVFQSFAQPRSGNENPAGIWKSVNGGISCCRLIAHEMSVQTPEIGVFAVNLDVVDGRSVVVSLSNHSAAMKGRLGKWFGLNPRLMGYNEDGGGLPGQAFYDLALAVHPNDDSLIYGAVKFSYGSRLLARSRLDGCSRCGLAASFDRVQTVHRKGCRSRKIQFTCGQPTMGCGLFYPNVGFQMLPSDWSIGQIYHLSIEADDSRYMRFQVAVQITSNRAINAALYLER